jgi:hypothetical protein
VAETLSVARVGFCDALVMFLIQLEAYNYVLALPTLSMCLEEPISTYWEQQIIGKQGRFRTVSECNSREKQSRNTGHGV